MHHSTALIFLSTILIVLLAEAVSGQVPGISQSPASDPQQNSQTVVTLRWGVRAGVSRYRLQVAVDSMFGDIVFDRVVDGTQYQITDLPVGRYFWRVASLTATLGEFSSAGVIDVSAQANNNGTNLNSREVPRPAREEPVNAVAIGTSWQTSVGNVSQIMLAHLRSPTSLDVVAVNNDDVVFAVDASNGVTLWRVRSQEGNPTATIKKASPVVSVRTRSGADNVVLFREASALMFDGKTGQQAWSTSLAAAATAVTVEGQQIFVIDNSLRQLFVLDANDGSVKTKMQLPGRAVGAPIFVDYQNKRVGILSLDDGRLEMFDNGGRILQAGDAGSGVTTAPLFVRSGHGRFIMVGTKTGLTALNADDLRPQGRVALDNDAPRGNLIAKDLDGDGIAEVIMFTDRNRILVVKSEDGKIVWQAGSRHAETAAFLDIDADGVLDLFLPGSEAFASVLSGRDGGLLWEEKSQTSFAANHATSVEPRFVVVAPAKSGAFLIAPDLFHNGLRAVELRGLTNPR